jgi:hypothetical protein
MVEPSIAHRAQKNSISFKASGEGLLRERRPIVLDCDPANTVMLEAKLVAADVGYCLQNQDCLFGYLRTDAITRQYDNA